MSNSQDPQKTLEAKIRPYSNQNSQDRPDQKGASRVHLCRETLLDLKLESGQPCYLWKVNETEGERRAAIAWLTTEKSLSKKVVQMSKSFQEACGFKLGDDVKISAGGVLEVAASIVLRDITAQELDTTPGLGDQDKPHWEWFLRENLGGYFFSSVRDSDFLHQGWRSKASDFHEIMLSLVTALMCDLNTLFAAAKWSLLSMYSRLD
jgi:AAA family ATPase